MVATGELNLKSFFFFNEHLFLIKHFGAEGQFSVVLSVVPRLLSITSQRDLTMALCSSKERLSLLHKCGI